MPVPIITVPQMRAWESATWAAGQTEGAVIAQVGRLVAERASHLTQAGDRILILAGKGHNGDDARQAAPHLRQREVDLVSVGQPASDLPALKAALQRRPNLIIDGLFGIGLNRPLDPAWIEFIDTVNKGKGRVLAVDNPSGLNVTTGLAEGACIRADLTLTLGAPKEGLFRADALACAGRVEVAPEIGLTPCPFQTETWWTLPEDFRDFPPSRPAGGHKGTFGHLAILAGSLGYHGAAVLAARGAQRSRPGLITLFPHEDVYTSVASQLQAVMVRPFENDASFDDFSAVLVGPGLASPRVPATFRSLLAKLWCSLERPLIVDASALDWLPDQLRAPERATRVLMPHPGEAARLLRCTAAEVQADRLAALRRLSQRFGNCWVVLKGQHTLVGQNAGPVWMNSSGNPGLAQGGSGDLLAGYLAGALAQPSIAIQAGTAIRYAVWQHGAAADALEQQRANWTVEELADRLGAAP